MICKKSGHFWPPLNYSWLDEEDVASEPLLLLELSVEESDDVVVFELELFVEEDPESEPSDVESVVVLEDVPVDFFVEELPLFVLDEPELLDEEYFELLELFEPFVLDEFEESDEVPSVLELSVEEFSVLDESVDELSVPEVEVSEELLSELDLSDVLLLEDVSLVLLLAVSAVFVLLDPPVI